MMMENMWSQGGEQSKYPSMVNYFKLPTELIYCLFGCIGLVGLTGNGLMQRMTCHPKFKICSYQVHLNYVSVVNSMNLVLIVIFAITDMFGVTHDFLTVNDFVCKLVGSIRLWVMDMAIYGLMGLTLDRYMAFVATRFKTTVCTRTNARLMCISFTFLAGFINIPHSTSFQTIASSDSGGNVCLEVNPKLFYVYLLTLSTGAVPCMLLFYLMAHSLVAYVRSRPQSSGVQSTPRDTGRETLCPLMAMTFVSLLIRLPLFVYEPLMKWAVHDIVLARKPDDFFTGIIHAEGIIVLITGVSLSCNFYVLMATSSFFRTVSQRFSKPFALHHIDRALQSLRTILMRRRGPEVRAIEEIQLPGDRRVMTAVSDGQVMESVSGQLVDLYQFNLQRERKQLNRELSNTDSVYSTSSSETVMDDNGPNGNGRHRRSTLKHNNVSSHDPLDSIGERDEPKAGSGEDDEVHMRSDTSGNSMGNDRDNSEKDPQVRNEENTTHFCSDTSSNTLGNDKQISENEPHTESAEDMPHMLSGPKNSNSLGKANVSFEDKLKTPTECGKNPADHTTENKHDSISGESAQKDKQAEGILDRNLGAVTE